VGRLGFRVGVSASYRYNLPTVDENARRTAGRCRIVNTNSLNPQLVYDDG